MSILSLFDDDVYDVLPFDDIKFWSFLFLARLVVRGFRNRRGEPGNALRTLYLRGHPLQRGRVHFPAVTTDNLPAMIEAEKMIEADFRLQQTAYRRALQEHLAAVSPAQRDLHSAYLETVLPFAALAEFPTLTKGILACVAFILAPWRPAT